MQRMCRLFIDKTQYTKKIILLCVCVCEILQQELRSGFFKFKAKFFKVILQCHPILVKLRGEKHTNIK